MLIAVDHGNKQIKVIGTAANRSFTSGLTESATRPPFGEDILHYNGRYYSLSEKRIPYTPDKTRDPRFYILTLFAVAFELEASGRSVPGETVDVQLAVGLPPAHYGRLYERFETYFMKNRVEKFTFRGKNYSIYITDAVAYPQAYAAAMTVYTQIKDYSKVMVLDIGGWTVDYMQIKSGKHDLSVCDSLENGVIHLYNRIKSKVSADFDLLLDESDIDAILRDKPTDYGGDVRRVVDETAQEFINDLFATLRERMVDLRTGKTVFVGGGSILLKRQITASGNVSNPVCVDEITANARGYELLYRATRARR